MKKNEVKLLRYMIALLVAEVACFLGGVIEMGLFFSIILLINLVNFVFPQKKNENNRFQIAECVIVFLGALLFGIHRLIMNDWSLVAIALIVVIFSGYSAVKISLMTKNHD